jgi:hypothetical protein
MQGSVPPKAILASASAGMSRHERPVGVLRFSLLHEPIDGRTEVGLAYGAPTQHTSDGCTNLSPDLVAMPDLGRPQIRRDPADGRAPRAGGVYNCGVKFSTGKWKSRLFPSADDTLS